MEKKIWGAVAMLGLGGLLVACQPGGPKLIDKADTTSDTRSGYSYAEPETQAMQDDDFNNPAMLWADIGGDQWTTVDGEAGKSCQSCHGEAAKSMKGVGAKFPIWDAKLKTPKAVEMQINECRTERMKAQPWKWESDQMLGMTMYVKMQSRGMPVNVDVSGPMKAWLERGKEFYNTRRGLLDMACSHCHVDNAGNMIRANRLSQGQANGFPTYRLKWQKPGSLHRRFKGCNDQVRAEPFKRGSEEYLALETYVMWRASGLPVETPAVRN
ncbi:MAG: sulfur oxidation c-type cytochrome SoxA [Hyphomicrobiales bacterium]|nr:sulfur oxidation c-type cytochrome SoxA [Hyphomicrobiales bacterium]